MLELRDYQHRAVTEAMNTLIENDSPVLFNSSVGSGKSLMIAEILKKFEIINKNALCITHNAQLVQNNAETFANQGGHPGIYCASLKRKETHQSVIFGSCQSVLNALKKEDALSEKRFNLIVIDESHMVNEDNYNSTYMRIIRHYKQLYPPMRILGLTGTPYRYNGKRIVGKDKFYHRQVADITMNYLVSRGFLVPPKYIVSDQEFDFNKIKLSQHGTFKERELSAVISNKPRLTSLIMHKLVDVIKKEKRQGAFIFASTQQHVHECVAALPANQTAYILAETTAKRRHEIIKQAREGKLKYLVNINVFTVGIDIPRFDTVCFVRPTESLVLLVQMIGRGMRLFPGKKNCLILDSAQNLERHADWDDPIILDALKHNTKDEDYCVPCETCQTLNTIHARRCIGVTEKGRCEHYFNFIDCPMCATKNDITARHCRECKLELIDPNAKLNLPQLACIKPDKLLIKWRYPSYHDLPYLYITYSINGRTYEGLYEKYGFKRDDGWEKFETKFVQKHYGYNIPKIIRQAIKTKSVPLLRKGLHEHPPRHPKYIYYKSYPNHRPMIKFKAFYLCA